MDNLYEDVGDKPSSPTHLEAAAQETNTEGDKFSEYVFHIINWIYVLRWPIANCPITYSY